jgi:hypothetical protein
MDVRSRIGQEAANRVIRPCVYKMVDDMEQLADVARRGEACEHTCINLYRLNIIQNIYFTEARNFEMALTLQISAQTRSICTHLIDHLRGMARSCLHVVGNEKLSFHGRSFDLCLPR